ncbi:unnamed protein product [Cochlearia groenlandica]
MEKEICRRHMSREGIGCVWVFMNMFDFRHNNGSNHKLLMDKKRGSKRIIGIETNVKKQLNYDCEESEDGMHSVKKLIEEEIDEKKSQHKCEFECRGGTIAKNRKKRSKTLSKDVNVLIACDDAEKSDDQCPRMSQKDESEEKFSELIKRLIAQKETEAEDDSKEEESLQCTQTIVILKPETHGTTSFKTKSGRFSSRYILSTISKRLKSVVGKKQCNAQHHNYDQDSDALCSNISQNCCFAQQEPDALCSNMSQQEDIDPSSRRRVSEGEMLREIASKSEADKEESNQGSEDMKKKSTTMCGIYIAAKKHLSEMLEEGDIDDDLPDKEVPRILGKILALSEFSTPQSSPIMTLEHDSVDHQVGEVPKIQQCSSEDYSETTSMSDMPGFSDTMKEEEEKTVLDSLSESNSTSTIQEEEHHQLLEKDTFGAGQSPSSTPNSSVKMMSECQEKLSPVSVLDPFFTDDDITPNISKFSMTNSAERRLQPLCIRFDEIDFPRHDKDNDVKTTMDDDKEVTLEYIQSVVESSELNWEELLVRSFYSEKLLEQALMEDIDFCPNKLCADKKLLFDCINEVLMELCGHGPWISLVKPAIRFCPEMENVVELVQEEVYWHLLPLPSPHTLDQIARKDLARKGRWMDLRFEIGFIGSEVGEIVLGELLEEVISNFTYLFSRRERNTRQEDQEASNKQEQDESFFVGKKKLKTKVTPTAKAKAAQAMELDN